MPEAHKQSRKHVKPRTRRKEVRRRILESAGRLIMEHGYQATSLSSVAEAAGFTKGAVYSNFANKDELSFELLSSEVDTRVSAIETALSGVGEAQQSRIAIDQLLQMVESEPNWQIFFVELWLRCVRRPPLRERFAKKRKLMRERIAKLLQAQADLIGYPLPLHAEVLATYILALSNGLGMEKLIDEKAVPTDIMGNLINWTLQGMATDKHQTND